MNSKFKVAIYDLTDCEGCQAEIVSLREKLLILEKKVDIVDWRLAQERKEKVYFDISLIEGTPITKEEVGLLKKLRQNSQYLIALGACACLAGIPGIINKKERKRWYQKIYGDKYKPRGIDALPLQAYVKVDFFIQGCPVDPGEVLRIISELIRGRAPAYRFYSVCFECKMRENKCRLLSKKPCLGPISQGGCGAVCVSGGSPCYGCFGFREEANLEGLLNVLKKFISDLEIKKFFKMFFRQTPEYQNFLRKILK